MGDQNGGDQQTSCCNDPQKAFIYLYIGYLIIVFITWGSIIVKPLRLLATFVHEMSHAIVCWLTCGDVTGIEVYENEGGVTKYRGGCRCLVAAAGYLGEAFWGMVFVTMSGGRVSSTIAAVGLVTALLVSLCYSPNRTMVYLNLTYAIITGVFIFIEWFVLSPMLHFVILLYGVFLNTYAIFDIFNHLIIRENPSSDAYALYEESSRCCLPRCVGLQWMVAAIVMQLCGIYLALILMCDECDDLGWFECIFHSRLDLEIPEFGEFFDWGDGGWDWEWPFDNGP